MRTAKDLIATYCMTPAGSTLLCAVSGGADSMCLLHYLHTHGQEEGYAVAAAHYNHHLRGEESLRDETFVRDICTQWGIPCALGGGDVQGRAAALGQGVEETARQMRYAFLQVAAAQQGASLIATAHNADDNGETLLLHLVRGTGLQGLAGIPPRRDNLIRPLLTTPRAAIEAYASAHAVPFIEDSTNTDTVYTRNYLRHTVMPLLRQLNPRLTESLSETAGHLRADHDFLNAQAAQIGAHARWAGDNLVIAAHLVAHAPRAVAPRVARYLLQQMGDGDTNCTAAHLNAMVALCQGDDPSATCCLPGGLLAQRVYGELLLTTEQEPRPFAPIALHEGENPISGTGWRITVVGAPPDTLLARPRTQGDALTREGRGTKTVKKLFIDAKIPRREREQIPVIADARGLLAVAGFGKNTTHPLCGQLQIICRKEEE